MYWKTFLTIDQMEGIHSDDWDSYLESLDVENIITQHNLSEYEKKVIDILTKYDIDIPLILKNGGNILYNNLDIYELRTFEEYIKELTDDIIILYLPDSMIISKDIFELYLNQPNIKLQNYFDKENNTKRYFVFSIKDSELLSQLRKLTSYYFD